MGIEDKKLIGSIKRATILSGVGMGLLLGIIMGLSVSDVVQTIFGVLAGLMGAFLGFDKRSYAGMEASEYEKEKYNTLFTALRAGFFGLAVVAGILSGIFIRTNDLFTMSVEKSVKQWTDAGFDADYARKLVVYKRLAIDPTTGELGQSTQLQRTATAALFSAEDRETLCGVIDPDNWNNDWKTASDALNEVNNKPLTNLVKAIEMYVPEDLRFDFLKGLRILVCEMNSKTTTLCDLGTDTDKWLNNEDTSAIAMEVAKLKPANQHKMMEVLSSMVCQLEKD